MREDELRRSIIQRMAVLKAFVSEQSKQGLTDAAHALETLYREVMNLTHGFELTSTNAIRQNFPAVDLHDPIRRIAVQVTVNCDSAKIKKTQDAFRQRDLSKQYDRLILVGIDGVKKPRALEPWTEVYQQSDLLNLEGLGLRQLEQLDDRLAQSIPWERFVYLADDACYKTVLSVLDRDAIRHPTPIEGHFGDMLQALKDIKQIVTEGRVRETNLRAKPRSAYSPEYQDILDMVDVHVGRMANLVRRHWDGHSMMLPPHVAGEVDRERRLLVHAVNAFSQAHGVDRQISVEWT